jgi:hypothetical protein
MRLRSRGAIKSCQINLSSKNDMVGETAANFKAQKWAEDKVLD